MDSIKDAQEKAQAALDDGVAAASHAVKQSAVIVRASAEKAYDEGQMLVDTGVAHAKVGQDIAFAKLKEGLQWAYQHQEVSLSAAGAAALVLLPGPRRLLWRNTLGRFRSEEALYKAAERKKAVVTESLEGQAREAQKLGERLAAAQEQYESGLRKLVATRQQLQSLAKQVYSTEKAANSLVRDLRDLPSKQALAMRAEVADQAAAAYRQRRTLDKSIWGLARKGI